MRRNQGFSERASEAASAVRLMATCGTPGAHWLRTVEENSARLGGKRDLGCPPISALAGFANALDHDREVRVLVSIGLRAVIEGARIEQC